jgi:nitrite reductase (NO-forming)
MPFHPGFMQRNNHKMIMKKYIPFLLFAMAFTPFCSTGQTTPTATSMRNGQAAYETYCLSCHMADGNGIEGVFPSLVKAGNLADKNRLSKIILQGIRGPVTSKGVQYDGEMAGIAMTDQEVADVMNYVRNSWGNKAPALKVEDVVAAKKAVVKGYQPY